MLFEGIAYQKEYNMKRLVLVGCLFGLSASMEAATLFEEDFSGCVAPWTNISTATNGVSNNDAISNFSGVGLTGWTGDRVFCAFATNAVTGDTNYMVRVGTGSILGWIQTSPMNLSGGGGDFTVTFRAGAWDNANERTNLVVELVTHIGTIPLDTVVLSKTEMKTYIVNGTGGTVNASIRFVAPGPGTSNGNRFFLDDVCVTGEPSTLDISVASKTETVFAGETVSAVVTATDLGNPILTEVEDTNIPPGNLYSFDGKNFSWTPQVTGAFWIRFAATNSTDKASDTLNITVNLPTPNTPTVKTTPGSIYLSWDPVPGATGYSVQVYKLATEIERYAEDFLNCTNIGSNVSSTTIGIANNTAIANFSSVGLDGWVGYSAFCAYASNMVNNVTNYMVKFGSTSAYGWIQTPPWDLSENDGECTLTFRAGKWRNDRGSMDVLHITDNGATTNTLQQITGMSDITMTKYTVAVTNGTGSSMICFTSDTPGSNSNRFFLDDVRLFYVAAAKIEIPSNQIAIDGTTARAFGLPERSEYLCTVTATDDNNAETVSPEIPARTTASTLIIVR